MVLLHQRQGAVENRLFVIGIPKYAIKPFLRLLCKWEECSGVEWTIKRLKGLKVDLIRSRDNLPPLTWIRKNRRGELAGVIGSLFRWAAINDRNFAKTIQAFMAYSFYVLPEVTKTQEDKFMSGINPVQQDDGLDNEFHRSFFKTVSSVLRTRRVAEQPRPLVTYQGSPDKRAPRFFGRTAVSQDSRILDDLQLFWTSGGLRLYQDFRELYFPLLKGLDERRDFLDQVYHHRNDDVNKTEYFPYGGEIHFLQEPGGKLRSIASPLRIHQEALRPLGLEIYRVIESLPWDCTFDQTRAIPHIQSCLSQRRKIHSIDLSSATDHFPLSLQMTALRALISKEDWIHLDLFEKISRGKWKSPMGNLSWTKGQPLGLFPSFGAFTLTHGLLLLHLNHGRHDNDFFVVGDDVVILRDSLRDDYIAMLDRMACPWSPDKTITSDSLSEFAGKIVTSSMVIPQLKWRKISDENFLDICRLLGKKSRCLLSSRQKIVFDQVENCCSPFGLNFSRPGDNLVTMIERTMDLCQPVEHVLGSLMGLRKRIHNVVYNSSESFSKCELEEISATFDEKVKSVMCQTLFSNWDLCISIGLEGLSTLPEALGLSPRLPLDAYSSVRKTTLERYERHLLQ